MFHMYCTLLNYYTNYFYWPIICFEELYSFFKYFVFLDLYLFAEVGWSPPTLRILSSPSSKDISWTTWVPWRRQLHRSSEEPRRINKIQENENNFTFLKRYAANGPILRYSMNVSHPCVFIFFINKIWPEFAKLLDTRPIAIYKFNHLD